MKIRFHSPLLKIIESICFHKKNIKLLNSTKEIGRIENQIWIIRPRSWDQILNFSRAGETDSRQDKRKRLKHAQEGT
ncbi:unnamed protein product [Brassica oleracea]